MEVLFSAADSPSAEGVPLLPSPHINSGFVEGVKARFFISGIHQRGQWIVDDVPLRADEARGGVTCSWTPGFFAGTVRAVLRLEGRVVSSFLLDVGPRPEKLGAEVFEELVSDLRAVYPDLLLGSESALDQFGTSGVHSNPFIAFERLRHWGGSAIDAWRVALRSPLSRLRSRRLRVRLQAAKRIDFQTVAVGARSPTALPFLAPREQAWSAPEDAVLDVPSVFRSIDVPANWCILSQVRALLARCGAVRVELERMASRDEAGPRTALAPRLPIWLGDLTSMEAGLISLVRGPVLRQVSRAEVTSAGLNAIAGSPSYSRAWRLGWKALRPGIGESEQNEGLRLSPTWGIYEDWCFLSVSQVLRAMLPQLVWSEAGWGRKRKWTGIGEAGMRVEVASQPVFRARAKAVSEQLWSVSGERRPDIVVFFESETVRKYLVLDAKYRASRSNLFDAMSSAHLYQDSLRWGDRRPEASVLLVPNSQEVSWMKDPSFIQEHRVGAIDLLTRESGKGLLRGLTSRFLTGGL